MKSRFIEKEYEIYKRYQMTIHEEPEEKCSRELYENFLIKTPLIYKNSIQPKLTYGSYHLQYR